MEQDILNATLICEQCGTCCKDIIIELLPEDIIREPRLKEFMRPIADADIAENFDLCWKDKCDYVIDIGPEDYLRFRVCPFLVDNKCSIYKTKPKICNIVLPSIVNCKQVRIPILPNMSDSIILTSHPERSWEINKISQRSKEELDKFMEKNGIDYGFYTKEERDAEKIKISNRLLKNGIKVESRLIRLAI